MTHRLEELLKLSSSLIDIVKKGPQSEPLKKPGEREKIRTCSECRRVSAFAQLFSRMKGER